MSIPALNWARRQRTGSPTRKAVLMDLADRANSDGECFPGQESIAHDLEMSLSTVRRAILDLERAGFLSVTRRSWPDSKRRRTSRYRLHVKPEVTVTGGGDKEPEVTVTGGKEEEGSRGHSDRGPEVTLTGGPEVTVTSDESEAVNRKHESKNPDAREKTPKQGGDEAAIEYLAALGLSDEQLDDHARLAGIVEDICAKDVAQVEVVELVAHCLQYLKPDELEEIILRAEDLPERPQHPSAILALVQAEAERNNINIPYRRLRRRRAS